MARWKSGEKARDNHPRNEKGPGGGKKLRNYMKLQICARMQRAEKKGQIEHELSILVAKIRHLGTLPRDLAWHQERLYGIARAGTKVSVCSP